MRRALLFVGAASLLMGGCTDSAEVLAPRATGVPSDAVVIAGTGASSTSSTVRRAPSTSSTTAATTPATKPAPSTTAVELTPMEPVKCELRDGTPWCMGWRIGGPDRPASQWWSDGWVEVPLSGMGKVSVGNGPVCAGAGEIDQGQGATVEGPAELWCWGEGFSTEGMDGRHYRRVEEPVLLHRGDDLDDFAAGYRTVCAIFGVELWCWGKVPGGWASTGMVLMADDMLQRVEVSRLQVTAHLRDGTFRVFNLGL